MEENDYEKNLGTFHSLYRDVSSNIFLDKNDERIYKETKTDSFLNPISHTQIARYKRSIESISRDREWRILRGRRRVLSFRPWRTYGPNNIGLADLCFIPDFKNPKGKKKNDFRVYGRIFTPVLPVDVQKRNRERNCDSFGRCIFFYGQATFEIHI